MATYYVRVTGNDSSAGTSAATAWRTIGKALGATGIASGDTVYLGAGHYGEALTPQSYTSETKVIGDVTGQYTGDGGEVVWTNYTSGPQASAVNSAPLYLNSTNWVTVEQVTFAISHGQFPVRIAGTTSNVTLRRCVLMTARDNIAGLSAVVSGVLNLTVQDCIFFTPSFYAADITLALNGTANYDVNATFERCQFFSRYGVRVQSSGTGAFEGGGVDLVNCVLYGAHGDILLTSGTAIGGSGLTIPCTIQDCQTITGNITAGEAGAITDLGGNVISGSLTNVTRAASTYVWPSSVTHGATSLVSHGHEWLYGLPMKPPGMPLLTGPARPLAGASTVDLSGKAIQEWGYRKLASGTATSATTSTIVDSGKSWPVNAMQGAIVYLTGGTGAGQAKYVMSNTATTLTVRSTTAGSGGLWATTPDSTTTYVVAQAPYVTTGLATATATTTTLTDGNANFDVNRFAGYTLKITGGTNSGESRTVTSNTATTLTVTSAFTNATDATSVYELYPNGSLTDVGKQVGLVPHNTALPEATTTDAGNGIAIHGYGSHEFQIPVDATSTTISIKARYDADHGTTNKPRVLLLAEGGIGVSAETKTMTSAADTWETLTFTAFTPSAAGVVTIRCEALADKPYGLAFFDTVTVS